MLIVCTGNVCRSALAERLGRAFLDEAMGDRAGLVQLASAGTRAVLDSAMHPDSELVLRGLGAEAGDFRSRQLADGMAADADLVLTMTRAHRRDVLHGAPRALARTFTLREAADLLGKISPDQVPSGTDLRSRVLAVVAEMAALRSHRPSGPDDDVPDPINRPLEVQEEVGVLIAEALLPILRRIAALDATPPMGDPPGRTF